MLDVAGFRARPPQRARRSSGRRRPRTPAPAATPVKLSPMTPFERKIVHDAVAAAGLTSESEGEEPARRVVVLPPV